MQIRFAPWALKKFLAERKLLHGVCAIFLVWIAVQTETTILERVRIMQKFALGLLAAACASALWASDTVRDEFFWLGEMNKATTVINTDEKLLDKAVVKKVAHGLQTVIANGNKKGGARPSEVIKFEPYLIKEAGMAVTMLHIGRSSQDMHATYRSAIMRDNVLALSEKLAEVMAVINDIARKNQSTIVPNYTNGVAAQPNSYAHYLMGYQASFERTQQQLRDFYERLNWCSMGTTVLNGTSWPLNRERMAKYLGFNGPVPNAYDASQMKSVDEPIEFAGIITGMAVRVGTFIEDVFVQYAQPRPWILLIEGGENTYVSSAMPQKLSQRCGLRTIFRQECLTTRALQTTTRWPRRPLRCSTNSSAFSRRSKSIRSVRLKNSTTTGRQVRKWPMC